MSEYKPDVGESADADDSKPEKWRLPRGAQKALKFLGGAAVVFAGIAITADHVVDHFVDRSADKLRTELDRTFGSEGSRVKDFADNSESVARGLHDAKPLADAFAKSHPSTSTSTTTPSTTTTAPPANQDSEIAAGPPVRHEVAAPAPTAAP